MGRLEHLYAHLPVWAQHSAVSAYGAYWKWLRFGPGTERYIAEYRGRDWFSPEDWSNWQAVRLREVLSIAAASVPYYRSAWGAQELAAARAGRLADLPILDKEAIRANPRAFVQDTRRARPELVFHTSGSTGTPIATYWRIDEMRRSMALREVRSAGWANVSFTMPRATFSGRMAEPDAESRGPFHRFNIFERQVYLSPFHLRPDTAAAYVNALARHHVVWLTGYAMSHFLLARHIVEQRLDAPKLRAVVTTSEKLTSEMRQTIGAAYRCRVYEEYSTVENVLFASECSAGRLHLSPDSAIVEILRPDGSPCDPGEPGQVVATGLLRDYQPLIRYRLGDIASWDPRPCRCGRAMSVLQEVVGRLEDVVVGADGRELVRFHGLFVDQPHVTEAQVIQEASDRLRIDVVPTAGFSETDVRDITARAQQRLGKGMAVAVKCVERIPRTSAGKFRAVVSDIPRRNADNAAPTSL